MEKLPAQVQEMADKADALIKEREEAAKPKEEKTVEKTKDIIKAEPTVEEPEHQELKVDPVKTEKTEEDWQHKYNVLKGKYNAEIKPLQDDVNLLSSMKSQARDLRQRVQEGDIVIRDLQEKLKQKEAPAPAKVEMPDSFLSLLSDEDRQHFEEEGIDKRSIEIIGKLAKEVSKIQAPQPNSVDSVDLEELKREAKESKRIREQAFMDKLSEKVIDWEAINQDEKFNDWLDEVIPYTSTTKRNALRAAHKQLNHSTAIKMFNDFKKTQSVKLPEPKKEPLLDPEKLIEPESTAGSHEVNTTPTGKMYTRAEIKQFYRDVIDKKYSKEDEKRIDRDIQKANREGRITN